MNKQLSRDITQFVIFILCITSFTYGLNSYLSGLTNPVIMKFILGISIIVAFVYDLKEGLTRINIIRMTTTSVMFLVAVFLAIEYREVYIAIVEDFSQQEGLEQIIGIEYVRAVENKAVGIGACFALALATIRLPFQSVIYSSLRRVLIIENGDAPCCIHCGQSLLTK